MNKEEFLTLVWRLEELLIQLDYLRSRIGNCGHQCEGLDAQDDRGLCPDCCDWLAKVMAEEERLSADMEFNEVMKKLKEACDQDKAGQLEKIVKQSREGRIVR